MARIVTTLYKQPGESRLFDMSFANKMRDGETIVSIDSITAVPGDLSFSGSVYSGQIVQTLISGGTIPSRVDTPEESYIVTFVVTTSSGQVLENEGILIVRET